jgi:hypothetical protein
MIDENKYIAPHAIVTIAGTKFDSFVEDSGVVSADILLRTDETSEATVGLYDPKYKLVDRFGGDKPLPGSFWLGWGKNDGALIYTGSLDRVEWSNNVALFHFLDASHRMKQEHKGRYHVKKTDYQILRKLATDNGLKFELKTSLPESEPFDAVMQAGRTDWQKALQIAHKAGLRLYIGADGGTLVAVEAGTTQFASGNTVLTKDVDFEILRGYQLAYRLPNNKKARPHIVEARGRKENAERITGQDKNGNFGRVELFVKEDPRKHSTAYLAKRAKSSIIRQREFAFQNRIKTLPSFQNLVHLRDKVTLRGVGGFFSGAYITTEVIYEFAAGKLTCDMELGADKRM